MWKGFALSSSIPPPLGGFCINASSRMSVSMAAGQCCLFSLWLPFSLLLVLSLAPPLLHTLTQLKKWNFPVFWRTLSGWTLRELLNAPCQAISHRQDEGKREALEKKPSLQIEWKWKHCKVNGWKFHKCHSPFAKTVFRQHNNPLQHYSVCRTITVQFYLSIFHSTVRFFSSHPLSSPSSGVRLIQMMTWGNWGGGQPKNPQEDSQAAAFQRRPKSLLANQPFPWQNFGLLTVLCPEPGLSPPLLFPHP